MEGGGETQIKNIETKNVFFKEPNKAVEEECRSTGQGCKLRRWMDTKVMNH